MDKGIKSKRRWAQWLSFISAVVGPAALVMFPQYTVPIGAGIAAVNGAAGILAKNSKDAENANTQTAADTKEVAGKDA